MSRNSDSGVLSYLGECLTPRDESFTFGPGAVSAMLFGIDFKRHRLHRAICEERLPNSWMGAPEPVLGEIRSLSLGIICAWWKFLAGAPVRIDLHPSREELVVAL